MPYCKSNSGDGNLVKYKKPEYVFSGDCPIKNTLDEILKTELLFLSQMKPFLLEDNDIEDIHNFRVVLRRLRGVMNLFKKYFNKERYLETYQTLKKLFAQTSEIRDCDIFLQNISIYMEHFPETQKTFELIKKDLVRKRGRAFKKFSTFLQDGSFEKTFEQLLGNLNNDFLLDNNTSTYKALKKVLNSNLKKISNYISDKDQIYPDDEGLHSFRIRLKKIRYLFEIFSSLFKTKRHAKFLKQLKNIQDKLGLNQDLAFQMNFISAYEERFSSGVVQIKEFIIKQKNENMLEFIDIYRELKKIISANKHNRLLK